MKTKSIVIDDRMAHILDEMEWREEPDGLVAGVIVEQLERKDYVMVNKVLEALGGKWNRKRKAHLFQEDPRQSIIDALADGVYVQKLDGYFPTPEATARLIFKRARRAGYLRCLRDRVLEPSAGEGHLADAFCDFFEFPRSEVDVVELNPTRWEILKEKGYNVIGYDFMDLPSYTYDVIVMNPPFYNGQDARHILKAWTDHLAPGGEIIAIASAGVTFRETELYRSLRGLYEDFGTCVSLPENSFKESGTQVNAVAIFLRKPVEE